MLHSAFLRRLMFAVLTCLAFAGAGIALPLTMTRAAHAQVAADFQKALSPYGEWIRHPRFGMVWVPDDIPADWQPYRYGHWIYTDEWGWYWISDPEEEDWGWVVFHYGRWAHERQLGWFWIPDDEWAPAWVDWRYGDDTVGWAPLPPDALIAAYDENPDYWIFVSPRFLVAPRLHSYIFSQSRRRDAFRRTHVVNRTLGYGRGRAAVNAGLPPAFIARAHGGALPTYRVNPRVLSRTQGIAGAVRVAPGQLGGAPQGQRGRRPSANRANAISVQPTNNAVAPTGAALAPQPLGRGERGRVGSRPPRAAQGAPPTEQSRPLQPQNRTQHTATAAANSNSNSSNSSSSSSSSRSKRRRSLPPAASRSGGSSVAIRARQPVLNNSRDRPHKRGHRNRLRRSRLRKCSQRGRLRATPAGSAGEPGTAADAASGAPCAATRQSAAAAGRGAAATAGGEASRSAASGQAYAAAASRQASAAAAGGQETGAGRCAGSTAAGRGCRAAIVWRVASSPRASLDSKRAAAGPPFEAPISAPARS